MVSTIKAEISRLNGEPRKVPHIQKNEADAKITGAHRKGVEELEAKGTGDQTAAEEMQKQLDELKGRSTKRLKTLGEESRLSEACRPTLCSRP